MERTYIGTKIRTDIIIKIKNPLTLRLNRLKIIKTTLVRLNEGLISKAPSVVYVYSPTRLTFTKSLNISGKNKK